jgi:hypothetical protein
MSDAAPQPDRFEFETLLTHQWQIADDLELIIEQILDIGMSDDAIVNVLQGALALHRLRCEKVGDMFEDLVRAGTIQ